MDINAMLLSDYYKQCHPEFYPNGMNYLFTFGTARMTRIDKIKHIIAYGFQGFSKEYLIEKFNRDFFNRPKQEVMNEINNFIYQTFSTEGVNTNRIADLHDLGYLPVRVWAVPEGTALPIYSQKDNPGVVQVPFIGFESTHPDFAWVAEFLESIASAQLWYPMLIATITKYGYKNTVDKFWDMSVDNQPAETAISEFGFRGAEGLEGAIMASSAFLTSFNKTATAPAVLYMKKYYGDGMQYSEIGGGMRSTEHSVMCSNYALDGNEDDFLVNLFTNIAPTGNVSVVCDSYDYWGRLEVICDPNSEVHKSIQSRNGTVYIRGDSGIPLEILTGKNVYMYASSMDDAKLIADTVIACGQSEFRFKVIDFLETGECRFKYYMIVKSNNSYEYEIKEVVKPDFSDIGTVEALLYGFNGRLNSKGYIILSDKVRAIYGDSITPYLTNEIYTALTNNRLAANNVALGAGSFSMQAWEERDQDDYGNDIVTLKPHTRDTFGIAFKATYGKAMVENGTEKSFEIYKNPKTDTGFKRSQRGVVIVYRDKDGIIRARDHETPESLYKALESGESLMRPIFENGKLLIDENLKTIRDRINNIK